MGYYYDDDEYGNDDDEDEMTHETWQYGEKDERFLSTPSWRISRQRRILQMCAIPSWRHDWIRMHSVSTKLDRCSYMGANLCWQTNECRIASVLQAEEA